jgi:serine/threonine-protein kinase
MLTGRRLFKAPTSDETLALVRGMAIAPPSRLNPAVPPALDAIVMRALRRNPGERFPNAGEMADALESFLVEQRFSSHELPRFLRNLFKEDGSADQVHLTPQELHALMDEPAASSAPGARNVTGEVKPSLLEAWPEVGSDAEQAPVSTGRPRRWWLLAAAGAALAVALVLVLAPGRPRSSDAHADAPATIAPAASAPAAPPTTAAPPAAAVVTPPPPAVTPPPAPALPKSVTISISSEPSGATVYLGDSDRPLGATPLELPVPRGPGVLRLRVAKAGYVPGLLNVVPDTDKPAVVTLAEKVAPTAPAPVRRRSQQQKVRNAIPIDPFR